MDQPRPRPRVPVTPALAAWSILVGTALLLPFDAIQLGRTVSFMPALISVVACFDVLSVCLLLGGYRDKGDLRLLLMAAAYAWSLVVMGGYALAFPGAVSTDPPLATSASVAPYLYVAWHGGFPLLLGIASAPWPAGWPRVTSAHRRAATARRAMLGAVATASVLVTVVVGGAAGLPALIVGLDTTRMTTYTAPVVLPLVLGALVLSHLGTRARGGADTWCTVTILVCTCDLVLTYSSGHRFSLGWYGGRMLTLVAAGIIVIAMLSSFRRLSALAEHNAAHDPLTGLANRRSVHEELERLVGLAQPSGRPVGVVSLDLDHFKLVNDRLGHSAGDRLLCGVAAALRAGSRAEDVVSRVGGEEFLVVLPGADAAGTRAAAEHLRRAVSALAPPDVPCTVTASVGTTTLQAADRTCEDLLRRADEALYAAKHAGRDRVVDAADLAPARRLSVVPVEVVPVEVAPAS